MNLKGYIIQCMSKKILMQEDYSVMVKPVG